LSFPAKVLFHSVLSRGGYCTALTAAHAHDGGDKQTFGVNQQDPRVRGCYKSGDGSGGAISPLRAALSAHAAGPLPLTLNMSWHDLELIGFLCLLAGLADIPAVIYKIWKFCRRKSGPFYLKNVRPLDGLVRDHPLGD
jgi:hypothetical protein